MIGILVVALIIAAGAVAVGPGRLWLQKSKPNKIADIETPETPQTESSPQPSIETTPIMTPTDTSTPMVTATPADTVTPNPTATPEPTDTPIPTATPIPTSTPISTVTPTPSHTPDFPNAEIRYIPLSIQHIANSITTDGYSNPPLGRVELGGIPFDLGNGESVITQANPIPDYPTSLLIPADVAHPQAIYLLLTGGNLYTQYNSQKLGEVRLNFDNGDSHTIALIAGDNIREWKHYQDNVVSRLTSPYVTEVWRGENNDDSGVAVIDMLRIDVPESLRNQSLTSIEILDQTLQTVGEMDPAINLNGVTVSALLVSTPTPVPSPTPVVCDIQPQGHFAVIWRDYREILGCPLNTAVETGGATQRFQHGRMIWRKNIDWHYVLFDDGHWENYKDEHSAGMSEPGYQAPPGLVTPVRGFGIVWRKYMGGPDSPRIGWALEDEYWAPYLVQDFEKGLLVELEGKTYVLGNNGAQWFNP